MHIKITFKNKEELEEAKNRIITYGGVARIDEINRVLYCNQPEDIGKDIIDICDEISNDKDVEIHNETY